MVKSRFGPTWDCASHEAQSDKAWEVRVSETNPVKNASAAPERIPVMQQILDNPFLLLFIGVTVPTVFYIVWGVIELIGIPVGK